MPLHEYVCQNPDCKAIFFDYLMGFLYAIAATIHHASIQSICFSEPQRTIAKMLQRSIEWSTEKHIILQN